MPNLISPLPIFEYAQTHGPWVFHEEPPAYLEGLTRAQRLRNMRAWNARGIILLQSRLREVKPLSLPMVVSIESQHLGQDAHQILCDNEEIGRMGAKALLALGLRHYAYCGLPGLEFSDLRGSGFAKAIEEAGHSTHAYFSTTPHLGQSWYAEQKALARWLISLPKPAGLLACNDDRARLLTEVCRLKKIRVPDEIAILGVDNDEQVCKSANPPLSSIALSTERAGYEAAALLDSLMKGRERAAQIIQVHPTHTAARQSTDTLAIEDSVLVRALRFIRDNSNQALRVADLPRICGISRRALQDLFKQHLGRTPQQEIHRCRANRIAQLLLETNLTVGEIAAAAGFDADAHVARFFSRQTGLTPLEYRRTNRLT